MTPPPGHPPGCRRRLRTPPAAYRPRSQARADRLRYPVARTRNLWSAPRPYGG